MLASNNQFSAVKAHLALSHPKPTTEPPANIMIARKQECATLATIKKYMGEQMAIAFVTRAVAHYAQLTQVQAGLTNSMLAGIARSVIRKYYYLTCNDVMLALRMMVEGDWGPLYAKLDMTSVLEAMRQYTDLKQEHARQEGMSGQAADFTPHPQVASKFKEIRLSLEENNRLKAEQKRKERIQRGELPGPWFSLTDACEALLINPGEAITNLRECFQGEWNMPGVQSYAKEKGVDFRLFCNIRGSEWLNALNKHYHPTRSNPNLKPS